MAMTPQTAAMVDDAVDAAHADSPHVVRSRQLSYQRMELAAAEEEAPPPPGVTVELRHASGAVTQLSGVSQLQHSDGTFTVTAGGSHTTGGGGGAGGGGGGGGGRGRAHSELATAVSPAAPARLSAQQRHDLRQRDSNNDDGEAAAALPAAAPPVQSEEPVLSRPSTSRGGRGDPTMMSSELDELKVHRQIT